MPDRTRELSKRLSVLPSNPGHSVILFSDSQPGEQLWTST